jgi:beta-galactosidase
MKFNFGVDYYPEHWPKERWNRDIELMKEADINIVRLAEFAWCLLEPKREQFDFSWLDEALELLQAAGIRVVLGTPTASPPPWVMAEIPDAFAVSALGRVRNYGGRRGYCPNHAGFLEHCRRITGAMAGHYADHPNVIGWQIDNEFSVSCYCPTCRARFQVWLREKYHSLEALNEAWGSVFWGHVYSDWAQIPVPFDPGARPTYGSSPGLELDYRRFLSDTIVAFQKNQAEILRRLCPGHFITHNSGFGFKDVDFRKLSKDLDFVSLDYYDRIFDNLRLEVQPEIAGFTYDFVRGFKKRGFWLTELQGGPSGWKTISTMPRPGEMRLWTYQAIAHGAESIIYFRWRSALFGHEQYWHGVLDHHGEPRRRYQEIRATGHELKRLAPRLEALEGVKAKAALIVSYDTLFAFQDQPNQPDFTYFTHMKRWYAALFRHNIAVDIIPPGAPLDGYRLVLAPALYVLAESEAAGLRRYVEDGGLLLVTARSGVKDTCNRVVNMPLPGLLAELCGVEVDEYEPLPTGACVALDIQLPGMEEAAGGAPEAEAPGAHIWCDILTPRGAETVATYREQFYAGRAAATLNEYGKGKVLYLGTMGNEALREKVADWLVTAAGLTPDCSLPAGVEALRRWNGEQAVTFILNHSDETQTIALPEPCRDVITGNTLHRTFSLAAKDVAILEESR